MIQPTFWSKTFLASFGLTAGLVLAGAAWLNWLADPAGLFSTSDYETRMASALTQGKQIGHPGNFDERLLQKRRSELDSAAPIDHLVIGSSRAMLIDRTMLPGELRNVAVSGAVLEDYVALWTLWKTHQPKTVWIVADPWIFNRNNDQRQWEALAEEYKSGLALIRLQKATAGTAAPSQTKLWLKKTLQLINWEYTKTSWLKVTGQLKAGEFVVLEHTTDLTDSDVIASAGNRIPGIATLHPAPQQVQALADEFSRKPSYLFKNFYTIDQGLKQTFVGFLAEIHRHSEVRIILPPLHPLVYERYMQELPPFAHAESEFVRIAKDLAIPFAGSFSPAAAGCNEHDFYDGIHPLPDCIRRQIVGR